MFNRILISDPLAVPGLDLLRDAGLDYDVRTKLSATELIAAIPAYDALIIRSGTQVTADVIAAAERLQVIARAGVGLDNIDIDAATRRGITVVNAPTGNVAAAAEHSLALIMALARNIPAAQLSMIEGVWNRKAFMGVELRDKTLGLIGLGRVASQLARRARGLGMNLLAYDPYVSTEYAGNMGADLVDLHNVLTNSDFISTHLPLTEQTRGMIGIEELALCRPTVRIVNTARGGIIDEDALVAALDQNLVAGAALDVFVQEPLAADSLLRSHPKLILTPHIGGSTSEAQYQVAIDVASQVVDVLQGRPARYAVNAPLISSEHLQHVLPYINLVETLGRFLTQYKPMQVQEVELMIHGPLTEYDTTILLAAALRGLLADVVEEQVNIINADHIAQRRGITVSEQRQRHHHERFENIITLKVRSGTESTSVRGSVLAGESYIVAIDDLWVDFKAQGHFLLAWHHDKPGVIGDVGTILGKNDVNIAFMHVGRRTARGEAIMVLHTDELIAETLVPVIDDLIAMHKTCIVTL